ncbi:MAG: twin-arginine translocation signal domain-containing protein, partial [Planctomycetota bacterium]
MSQTNKPSASRRQFLKTSSALAAAGAVAGTVLSPSTSRAGYHVFGSDTIRVGVIGSGGRGSGAMADALNAQSGNVEVTAVGDLFADRPEGALGGLKERYKDRIKVTTDTTFIGFDAYKKVLETDC